ncbi:hypothetical protein CLU83_3765 [Flavobacterium sp. 1]|uniref:hypothetical protein n=1 Tax=Flavobacterium sp. 1 TaxID=2035200 RepID=UPI000C2494A6|nr:hypothetical protein [Flavobacterium sp. 1]PJJ10357.1 hypothetical protein CLU83_3765 [Flavobacterium sp. 1]
MKTILNKALYKGSILLFCLYGYIAHAETCYDGSGNVVPCDPAPPTEDTPIDGNITILIIIAVLFGIYIIYNYKINKKRPI